MSVSAHIAAQRTDHGVAHAVSCRALGVAASTFYKWRDRPPTPAKRRRAELDVKVRACFDASGGTYGSPRVRAALRRSGPEVSKKTVESSMARQGLQGRARRRRRGLTRPDRRAGPVPDLLRRLRARQRRRRVVLLDPRARADITPPLAHPRPGPPRHRRLDRHLVQQKTAPLHQQHDQPNRLRTSQRSLNQPSTIWGEAHNHRFQQGLEPISGTLSYTPTHVFAKGQQIWPVLAHRIPAFERAKVLRQWAGLRPQHTRPQRRHRPRHRGRQLHLHQRFLRPRRPAVPSHGPRRVRTRHLREVPDPRPHPSRLRTHRPRRALPRDGHHLS